MQYGERPKRVCGSTLRPVGVAWRVPQRVVVLQNKHDIDQAVLLHQSGRLDEAAAVYQQVLQTSPDDYSALYLLGVIAHQRQDYHRAIELLERAMKADPVRGDPQNVLGLAFKRTGKLDVICNQRSSWTLRPPKPTTILAPSSPNRAAKQRPLRVTAGRSCSTRIT